jgi:hypothetical protein
MEAVAERCSDGARWLREGMRGVVAETERGSEGVGWLRGSEGGCDG